MSDPSTPLREGVRSIDLDLSLALMRLILAWSGRDIGAREKEAKAAVELAEPYPSSWVSRVIRFLAKSFFLYDATGATEIYGSMAEVEKLISTESLEAYFLRGYSRMFRGERDLVLPTFRAALALEADNPYVLFSMMFPFKMEGATNEILSVREKLRSAWPNHPLNVYADNILKGWGLTSAG